MDLTVAILTKNEEKHIAAVIANVKELTDKVLIVDSGSTDKTVELAEEAGAKVVFRAWDNDFAAQRNFALQHITTKWVLYLDADERLNPALIMAIRKAITQTTDKKYIMLRKIQALGFKFQHGAFKPDKVTRLFPTKQVTWEHKVHERPVCKLPEEKLDGWMDHYTFDCWESWWNKAGLYTTIWAEDAFAQGKRIGVASPFVHAFSGMLKVYFVQLGFLDGWAGIYSTAAHGMYILTKYLKLYHLGKP